jgi:hypothetical protein
LVASTSSGRNLAIGASRRLPFPVYYPRLMIGMGSEQGVRRYTLRDEQGHRHHAYRIVFSQGLIGDYYGVEGTDWTNPPLLTTPSTRQTIGGRTYELFYDGSHLRWVAWRTPHAVYWVSNTLVDSLSQRQMLAIAESTAPVR